jgi:hypothetical protein
LFMIHALPWPARRFSLPGRDDSEGSLVAEANTVKPGQAS